jgi:transcriptional regulator with XRE-family HTH domain
MDKDVQYLLDLQKRLLKIIEEYPISYAKYAKQIGVTEHTLIHFLQGDTSPTRFTRWKIERFLLGKEKK